MPNITSEGLLTPLANETVSRQAYLDNVNATNTALAKKANKDGTLQTGLNADLLDGFDSAAFERKDNKGQSNGYAGLDANSLIPEANIGTRIYKITASGSANTYTAAVTGLTAYTDGLALLVKIPATNTGASTIAINALGAKSIFMTTGAILPGWTLAATSRYLLIYSADMDGFVLSSRQGNDADTNSAQTFMNKTLSAPAITGVPTMASTTKVTNLNADMVDAYHAGNLSGNVPVSNGTVNTNLNADKVDGYDVGNASGTIPISNGAVNANLNADMIDGYHAGVSQGQVLGIPTGGAAGQALLLQANGTLAWGDAGMICKTIKSADLVQQSPVVGTLYTLLSASGKGQLTRLSTMKGNDNAIAAFVVTVDGGTALTLSQTQAQHETRGIAGDSTYGRSSFFDWLGSLSFTTALLVQVKITTTGSGYLYASADYALV